MLFNFVMVRIVAEPHRSMHPESYGSPAAVGSDPTVSSYKYTSTSNSKKAKISNT
jgi:hypothetical protein